MRIGFFIFYTVSQYFSPEGLEKLKKELEDRKGTLRIEINKRILAAKELGDLSENAEFTEAKEAQAFNEGRIAEIEDLLKEAKVVDPNHTATEVMVGSTVVVNSTRGEQKFTIVGPSESNPAQGFISNESPIGKALVGHKKGDVVEVRTPGGIATFTIVNIM